MQGPLSDSSGLVRQSANERFKAGWRGRVAVGTLIGSVAHVALFASGPGWLRESVEADPMDAIDLEWIAILPGEPRLQGLDATVAESAPARPLGTLPDSLPSDAGLGAGGDGSAPAGASIATTSELFRERLTGGFSIVPTIVEQPGLDDPSDSTAGEVVGANGDPGIPERELTTADFPDFADLPGTDPMGLDRLSALRPELSLSAPSAWVLIRNPREVEEYIQRSYRSGDLARGANGSVSVALWIDERGSVEWAEISASSGREDLDQIALRLFSEVAAFRPARDQGVPIPRSVIFSVRFPWY